MTTLRAFHRALVCGAFFLAIAGTVNADVANYTIDAGSSQSNVDNACVGALPGATGEDCTYNQTDQLLSAQDSWNTNKWVGPVYGSGYYRSGDSPFQKNPGTLPQAAKPDADTAELTISGSLVIDDQNGTTCDGDDTISGRFELEAGTRTFSGGPGTWGEETWGADTVVYVLPESVPDFQNTITEGCEYIFGSQGFPPLLQTMGLLPAGVQSYPVDAAIGSDPINPNPPDNENEAWDSASNPTDIGVGTFEGAGFAGNVGVEVTLDDTALNNGTFACVANSGDPNNPSVTDGCVFGPTASGPCATTGAHFCGVRRVMENWIVRIVVDPSGDIVEDALIFANNESIVFNIAPAPGANNSWDGPLITFTATCDDCSVAKNDTYNFVTGTNATVPLAVGANDDPSGQLGTTTLTIDAPGPTGGSGVVTGSPGNVANLGIDYTATNSFNAAFTDSFTYTLDDGVLGPEFGLQGTVSITVTADTAPVANAYTITLDSQGAAPASLRNTTNVLTGVTGNSGGNNPTVAVVTAATAGTATVSGAEITYVADADFFQGSDSFTYRIVDNNFNSPGTSNETAGPTTVTVNIADVSPTAADVDVEVDAGESVDFTAAVTLGNGSLAQHQVAIDCDSGSSTVSIAAAGTGFAASGTYTAPADFEGDATCTYTVTDEDGNGNDVDGTVTITVTESGIVIKLPGGSAMDSWSLVMLLMLLLVGLHRARGATNQRSIGRTGVES